MDRAVKHHVAAGFEGECYFLGYWPCLFGPSLLQLWGGEESINSLIGAPRIFNQKAARRGSLKGNTSPSLTYSCSDTSVLSHFKLVLYSLHQLVSKGFLLQCHSNAGCNRRAKTSIYTIGFS
jgi:hypothetical protein